MFSKPYRLRKEKDILRTLKGKSVFDAACGVKFKKNGTEQSRFAIVTGKKVHKSAVKRNRIRRQYSEILRLHLSDIAAGYDMVFLTSKQALDLTYQEKEERLLRVLKKAGLL